jgi:hypothetical protein
MRLLIVIDSPHEFTKFGTRRICRFIDLSNERVPPLPANDLTNKRNRADEFE